MCLATIILEYLRVLIWPITMFVILFLYRGQLVNLLARITHADLPGGVSVDLKDIQETKKLSDIVEDAPPPKQERKSPSIPLTEANARLLQVGLRPSPSGLDMNYYKDIARTDPNIALAGLRIEIDILARNLAKGFSVDILPRDFGSRLFRKLNENAAITDDQMKLAMKVLNMCNAAAHGTSFSLAEAEVVIDSADVLAQQYLSWLGWGFEDDWKPNKNMPG